MELNVLDIVLIAVAGGALILGTGCLIVWLLLRRRSKPRPVRISSPLGGLSDPNETYVARPPRKSWRFSRGRSSKDSGKDLIRACDGAGSISPAGGRPCVCHEASEIRHSDDSSHHQWNRSLAERDCMPTITEQSTAASTPNQHILSPGQGTSVMDSKPLRTPPRSDPKHSDGGGRYGNPPWSAPPRIVTSNTQHGAFQTHPTKNKSASRRASYKWTPKKGPSGPRSFSYPLKPKAKAGESQPHTRAAASPGLHASHTRSGGQRLAQRPPLPWEDLDVISTNRIQHGAGARASVRPQLVSQDSYRLSIDETIPESNGSHLSMSLVTANPTPIKAVESPVKERRANEARVRIRGPDVERHSVVSRNRETEWPASNHRRKPSDVSTSSENEVAMSVLHRLLGPESVHYYHDDHGQRGRYPPSRYGSVSGGPTLHGNARNERPEIPRVLLYSNHESPFARLEQTAARRLSQNSSIHPPRSPHVDPNEYPPTPTRPAGSRRRQSARRSRLLPPSHNPDFFHDPSLSSHASHRDSAGSVAFTVSSDGSLDPFIAQMPQPPSSSQQYNTSLLSPRPGPPRARPSKFLFPGADRRQSLSPRSYAVSKTMSDAINELRRMNSDTDVSRDPSVLKRASSTSIAGSSSLAGAASPNRSSMISLGAVPNPLRMSRWSGLESGSGSSVRLRVPAPSPWGARAGPVPAKGSLKSSPQRGWEMAAF